MYCALFQKLIIGDWIEARGPTGTGKSWLACALGHKACRDNRSVLYQRVPKLFGDLALARGDGRYPRVLRALGGVQLLILDDWGLKPLDPQARHDLLEILEERYGRRSTIVTSQLPVYSRISRTLDRPIIITPDRTTAIEFDVGKSTSVPTIAGTAGSGSSQDSIVNLTA